MRAVLQPLIQAWFRLRRHGREHLPASGPVILAANHRSFLDPFVIGCCVRRPIYFVAKRELFERRLQAWLLNALGAFPVRREESDEDTLETARALLRRGEVVVIFPEGTRIRHGSLGRARRGIGRLALETGAPVVPVAVAGSEHARRGWRIRPVGVRVRCGRPLTCPRVESPSRRLASEVTARIWPCVQLQWEWLGGLPPLRDAAVVGAGPMGQALAEVLARAGLQVTLCCRSEDRAASIAADAATGAPYRVVPTSSEAASDADLVALAVPARALPTVVAELGDRVQARAAVLVLSKGLVPPLGTTPTAYVGERVAAGAVAWLGGPSHAAEMRTTGASVVLASHDPDLAQRLAAVLRDGGLEVERSDDVIGAELAGCAKNVATLAAAAAAPSGMNAAGAAAARVFSEVNRLALRRGASGETFAGLAGAGDLVATALAPGSRNRRAGELLGRGASRDQIAAALGATAEALDSAPLLAERLRREGAPAPAATSLAALVEGRLSAGEWVAGLGTGTGRGGRWAA